MSQPSSTRRSATRILTTTGDVRITAPPPDQFVPPNNQLPITGTVSPGTTPVSLSVLIMHSDSTQLTSNTTVTGPNWTQNISVQGGDTVTVTAQIQFLGHTLSDTIHFPVSRGTHGGPRTNGKEGLRSADGQPPQKKKPAASTKA